MKDNSSIFRSVQIHRKIERKVQNFPNLLPSHVHSLPHFQYPSERPICCEASIVTALKTKPIVYISVYCWCCAFLGLDKHMMTLIHHYGITQNHFTALKILCAPHIQSSLSLNSWQSLISFLSAQFCLLQNVIYAVGVMQYIAFLDGPLTYTSYKYTSKFLPFFS